MNAKIDIGGVVLKTRRLTLRPWRQEDLEDFYAYASVDGVGQMAGWKPHESLDESRQILDRFIEKRRIFAIEYLGKAIGSVGIEEYSEEKFPELAEKRCREIGYVLAKPYWGQGLMPEAVREVIRYLFEEVELDVILCGHFLSNRQSARVQEKCGFRHYAFGTYERKFGTVEDDETNILTKEDWLNIYRQNKEREETRMEEKIIKTAQGLLRGRTDGETAVFMGVPFAAPPVGDLRWRAPQPPLPWAGVREAVLPPPMPVQTVRPGTPLAGHEMSEDCLYLNIWAPAQPKEKCAVLVWFYGGSLQAGNADSPIYDGHAYARDGVVLVTVGYRVGVFGFLCHPDMKDEDEDGIVGNFGHRDQLAALKWIRENIEAFGGDPGRVTVSGQSAGSASCCALMNAPSARGYLHQAICHSGDIFQPERDTPVEEAMEAGKALAESFGCKTLDEFRRIPFPEMYKDGDPMMARQHRFCAAVIDGVFLPQSQGEIMLQGKAAPLPVIVGTNFDEGSRFGTPESYVEIVTKRLGISPELYTQEDVNKKAAALARDYWYGRHLAWAKIRSNDYGIPTWEYVFGRRLGPMGAFHGMEIPYTFATLDKEPDFGRKLPYTPEDEALSKLMHAYWVNFIKTGDPNGAGLPEWPGKKGRDDHMYFDACSGMQADVTSETDAVTNPAVEKWMRSRI